MSDTLGPAVGPDGEPRPVAEIDEDLFDYLKPLHRARWALLTGFGCLLMAVVIILSLLYARDHQQLHDEQLLAARQQQLITAQAADLAAEGKRIRASCGFWAGLAGLPATPASPRPGARPTRTAVVIIAGSRDAYQGQGCGKLAPPDPSLVRWARFYHIPVRR